jgi:hypothetical protein
LVDDGDYRRGIYLPLNRLSSQSKNPGCFGAWAFACTGFAFFFGVVVGGGVAVGDGVTVTVGVGILVGIRVGILVGMRSGSGVLVGMTSIG